MDKADVRTFAMMLMPNINLKSYSDTSYHNEELKSLSRHHFDKVQERTQLKQSVSRLVTILFPELEKLVPSLLLYTPCFPPFLPKRLPPAIWTRLTKLLENVAKGRYISEKAIKIRKATRIFIGSNMPAKLLGLKHTLRLIDELDFEITEIESEIKWIMDWISSSILSIPKIDYHMNAMILVEIRDFSRFDSLDKILAYAGVSPPINLGSWNPLISICKSGVTTLLCLRHFFPSRDSNLWQNLHLNNS